MCVLLCVCFARTLNAKQIGGNGAEFDSVCFMYGCVFVFLSVYACCVSVVAAKSNVNEKGTCAE